MRRSRNNWFEALKRYTAGGEFKQTCRLFGRVQFELPLAGLGYYDTLLGLTELYTAIGPIQSVQVFLLA